MLLSPGGGGKDLVKDGFDSADDFLGKFCLSTRTVGSTAANNDPLVSDPHATTTSRSIVSM